MNKAAWHASDSRRALSATEKVSDHGQFSLASHPREEARALSALRLFHRARQTSPRQPSKKPQSTLCAFQNLPIPARLAPDSAKPQGAALPEPYRDTRET